MLKERLAFIGAGNMAEAIIGGILEAGLTKKENITAADIKKERLDYLGGKFGINGETNAKNAVKKAEIIFLSVKPQNIKEVLEDIKDSLKGRVVISIAAGIKTGDIEEITGEIPVVRVMPNTPALVKKGMAAVSKGKFAGHMEEETACRIFESVGKAVRIEEKYMDIITAVSGSGPGYVFYIMEALIEAGVKNGLPRDTARTLVFQTLLGAAELAVNSGREPEDLRKAVCSPGGTTLAGLAVLEQKDLKGTLVSAVDAARRRSEELSKSNS